MSSVRGNALQRNNLNTFCRLQILVIKLQLQNNSAPPYNLVSEKYASDWSVGLLAQSKPASVSRHPSIYTLLLACNPSRPQSNISGAYMASSFGAVQS